MSKGLWAFAQQWYARPEVEAACLALQAAGGNVCLVLCAAWLGLRGVAWQTERAQALATLANDWQSDVIAPLRSVRIQWKGLAVHDAALAQWREQIKTLELAAERELLTRMETLAQWPENTSQSLEAWLASSLEGIDTDTAQALFDTL
ncbi:TIGR02444 family protein [Pseudomonas sp. KNUC1026]|uniref:TIGR02444 family protein n=1 Tax=Pseudomonas sp. KNUC1026 TaxID=2893890 RepID=UPI001F41E63B|nr:TIGR02444 family protein [Pseudomonas sp. KNUC1026]UFH49249.1 TIGR02444 family protein [Pseudomonas sp. KNUC1026]